MMRAAGDGGKISGSGRVVTAGFGYGFATLENPSWSLHDILLATGGRLAAGKAHAGFRCISTDSRTVKPGDIFLALAGENYDGMAFVDDAVKNGAAGIIVNEPQPDLSLPVVVVSDTLAALGDLAAYRRANRRDLKVLAVTGSSGKTTVKDMAAAILAKRGRVIKTRKNFNNLVGLPLSLLPVSYCHDFAVLEMGMNAPGEIARLTEIADPDIACINNIHPAHLAGLGSINGVASAKGELFAHSRTSTILVVNIDDPMVRRLARNSKSKMISFGRRRGAAVRATHIHNDGVLGSSFTLHIANEKIRLRLGALGEHNILNSLAAAAMAWAAGADIVQIAARLTKFTPAKDRLQFMELANGLRLVNDSYNANPASMRAAMTAVQRLGKGEQCIAVLGDMLELGKFSTEAHAQIGEAAASQGFSYLLAVGDYAKTMAAAARKAGMKKDRAMAFTVKEDAAACLQKLLAAGLLTAGDLLLLKGSRGMKMEKIIGML
ncbi:MAG: UDP-N-acetylmuramoyl-tripeptide--D-alanyl-D-alanine ligase [Deltaproteobacteria bacterium]|nr:UDP-N-acetylmuramoyl-tripeptide--D-alanyl-D-alanine ligase [Deltaproteobacteria bacterium]